MKIYRVLNKLERLGICDKNYRSMQIIGGRNVIVEEDESKFGKRKYHRGHHVDGVWILGAVERTIERRIVLKSCNSRNSEK